MKRLISFAILCLVMSGCGKREAPAGQLPPVICKIPVYDVDIYEYMGGILSGPLYIATVDAPDSVIETSETIPGEQFVPICEFTTIGDVDGNRSSVGQRFWLLDLYDSGITKTYHVRAGRSGYSSTTVQAGYLNSLAKKTSADNPMYLVASGGFYYMVIGETAYCPNPWAPELVPEALPELDLGDGTVNVVKIE